VATRIIEFLRLDGPFGEKPLVPMKLLNGAQAAITATSTSQQSEAFGDETTMVCVQSDEAIHVAFGDDPEATTDDYRIQAGADLFASVGPGQKVAVRT